MLKTEDNAALYTMFELQRSALYPVNFVSYFANMFHESTLNPMAYTNVGRTAAATFSMIERLTRNYGRPDFGIEESEVEGVKVKIKEQIIVDKPFCRLVHFGKIKPRGQKKGFKAQPPLLIVAPMSGHFATLCRGTVEDLLPHFDVYITDWRNARNIPLSEGPFGLDDYIDYLKEFIEVLGCKIHMLAVCQPAVPVFCTAALLEAEKNPCTPASITLIGGPIDTRKSPTAVNHVAKEYDDIWFQRNVITRVPFMYPGFMRKVYPGFVQLTGFMSMNVDRHLESHLNFFNHLVEGDGESADAHRKFYDEYLAVMDIPAEFYLETVKAVFQDHSVPDGKFFSRGKRVDPKAIKKTAILAIEGERDDISGVGQTKAALTITTNLPDSKKKYHLQKGVGHYGTFNGRRFREQIVPVIAEFARKHGK